MYVHSGNVIQFNKKSTELVL